MSESADPKWLSHFHIEIDQHLQAIEPVLGRLGPDSFDRSDIHRLLREFHSIKGLARAFAANGLEAMAHHAESLLSPGSGELIFDTAIQDLLIEACDALRDGLGEPFGWQAPAGLIESMRMASAATRLQPTAGVGSGEPENESGPWLGNDPQSLLAFAELPDELLPEAATAILQRDGESLREAIDVVRFACARLNLDGIEIAAQRVMVDDGAKQFGAFAELLQKAAHFGDLVAASCGAPEAARLLQDRMQIPQLEGLVRKPSDVNAETENSTRLGAEIRVPAVRRNPADAAR